VPASYVFLLRTVPGGRCQVLLQLRSGTGYRDGHWAAGVAGHVEAGESALDAARREALEELGIGVRAADLDPVTAMHRTQGNGHPIDERVDFFFTCRQWQGEPRIAEPHKAARLEWFDLDGPAALPEPLVPHELFVLRGLREGHLPPVVTFGFAPSGAGPAAGQNSKG
jgi:8-oxo-dGTP pyrophosphatase MutT (NUDIX family)